MALIQNNSKQNPLDELLDSLRVDNSENLELKNPDSTKKVASTDQNLEKRGRGRPSLHGEETKFFHFRAPMSLLKMFDAVAKKKGTNRSQLLIELMKREVKDATIQW